MAEKRIRLLTMDGEPYRVIVLETSPLLTRTILFNGQYWELNRTDADGTPVYKASEPVHG